MDLKIKTSDIYFKNLEAQTRYIFNEGGTRCFHFDQLVITRQGSKRISEIRPGEFVLTYNEQTKKNEYKRVDEALKLENSKPTLKITLKNGQTIICTEDHKFYFRGGWHTLIHLVSLKKKEYGNMETNTRI